MGYGEQQLADLTATIAAVPCDVVVSGTPIDLGRLVHIDRPVRHASYSLHELSRPDLASLLAPHLESWRPA
jgi:predicted GTPase